MFKNKPIKLIYGLVLILPLLYLLLYKLDRPAQQNHGDFHFYTSLKSPAIESIQFLKHDKLIHQWKGPFEVYKQLDYIENKPVLEDGGFQLKINHFNTADTICFLGLNFLMNGWVYSLQEENVSNLSCSTNAKILIQKGQLKLVCLDREPVSLDLKQPLSWSSNSIQNTKRFFFWLILFFFVLAVIVFRPSTTWFLISLATSAGMLFYFFLLGKDPSGQISMTGFSAKQKATFYFNNTPEFRNSLSVHFK